MRATNSFQELRVYMAFFLVILLISCGPDSNILPDPPVTYTKSAVAIKPAEKITMTSATVVAKIVPNENGTTVSFEYKSTNIDWANKAVPLTFSGKDSVTVTFDLSDLKLGTVYSFRVRATNVGGESVSAESQFETYAVSDFDGNGYHTVTIGTQTWLKENFKGTHYANGDPIANVTDANTWSNLTTGAYCWYNNDPKIGEVYGGLYNWYVGSDSRGLIAGWKVPTGDEWATLINYLGGWQPAGIKVMEVGSVHWKNTITPATNTSGFTALPNGDLGLLNLSDSKLTFMDLGSTASFWSSDLFGPGATVAIINASKCGFGANEIHEKNRGFGLRLMKN